jgi:hypothetical protein
VGIGTRIFGDPGVVVGSAQQARSPGNITVGKGGFFGVNSSILIGINEEVRVRMPVVQDGIHAFRFYGIRLDRLPQCLMQGLDLLSDAFLYISIAVVVLRLDGAADGLGFFG